MHKKEAKAEYEGHLASRGQDRGNKMTILTSSLIISILTEFVTQIQINI